MVVQQSVCNLESDCGDNRKIIQISSIVRIVILSDFSILKNYYILNFVYIWAVGWWFVYRLFFIVPSLECF